MNEKDLNTQWEFLAFQSNDHLKSSSLLLLHAAQFPAMAGRYLIPPRRDDSHILLRWYLNKKMLAGSWIDARKYPVKIGIKLPELILTLLIPPGMEYARLPMQGRTKEEVFDWLNDKMEELEVEMGPVKMELYYTLPDHETDNGIPFEIKNKDEFIEIAKIRSNTELILRHFSEHFNACKPIYITPYNLNSTYKIPVEWDENGQLKKYTEIGLSPPDSFVDRYYFYVKIWNRDEIVDFEQLQPLRGEGSWTTNNHLLAVLPLFKLLEDKTKEEQVNRLVSFFKSALNSTFDILLNSQMKLPE